MKWGLRIISVELKSVASIPRNNISELLVMHDFYCVYCNPFRYWPVDSSQSTHSLTLLWINLVEYLSRLTSNDLEVTPFRIPYTLVAEVFCPNPAFIYRIRGSVMISSLCSISKHYIVSITAMLFFVFVRYKHLASVRRSF